MWLGAAIASLHELLPCRASQNTGTERDLAGDRHLLAAAPRHRSQPTSAWQQSPRGTAATRPPLPARGEGPARSTTAPNSVAAPSPSLARGGGQSTPRSPRKREGGIHLSAPTSQVAQDPPGARGTSVSGRTGAATTCSSSLPPRPSAGCKGRPQSGGRRLRPRAPRAEQSREGLLPCSSQRTGREQQRWPCSLLPDSTQQRVFVGATDQTACRGAPGTDAWVTKAPRVARAMCVCWGCCPQRRAPSAEGSCRVLPSPQSCIPHGQGDHC